MEEMPFTDPYDDAREVRVERRLHDLFGADPVLAVVGDDPEDDHALTAAGWRVAGRVGSNLSGGYLDVRDVLLDGGLDALCVSPGAPAAGRIIAAAVAADLHVLMSRPGWVDPEALREAAAAAEDNGAEHAVAFASRWLPSYATATAMARQGQLPNPLQLTVRGWPGGTTALCELIDLVAALVGDVVAVAAQGAPLPAPTLPDGLPVRLALLTEPGVTVLVADGGPPLLRLSCDGRRFEVTPDRLGWQGGPALAVDAPTVRALSQPVGPPREQLQPTGTTPAGQDGLTATAARLAAAVRSGDGAAMDGPPPRPATLRDLLVALGVVEALQLSERQERWVEVG